MRHTNQRQKWATADIRKVNFIEVLNRPPPTSEADIQETELDLDINTAPPEKEEIIETIMSLKNKKVPGQDNMNAELFKADPELAAKMLLLLFTAIWKKRDTNRLVRRHHCENPQGP